MDISTVKTAVRSVEIKHPGTGDVLGIRLHIVHIDDERMAATKRKITDRRNHLEARNKTFTAEEIEENVRLLTFAGITGWEWYNPTGKEGDEGFDPGAMPDFHGDIPEFNRKNVNAMLIELSWFQTQAAEPMGDLKGFFAHSPET